MSKLTHEQYSQLADFRHKLGLEAKRALSEKDFTISVDLLREMCNWWPIVLGHLAALEAERATLGGWVFCCDREPGDGCEKTALRADGLQDSGWYGNDDQWTSRYDAPLAVVAWFDMPAPPTLAQVEARLGEQKK